MSLSVEAVAVAKKYTDNSIKGISGTLAGKNCTIKSIQKVDGVSTITFEWIADDGTVKTSTMNVVDGKNGIDGLNGKDGKDGINGKDGQQGANGVGISKIEKIGTVDLVDTYRITFTDNSTFDYEVKNGKDGQSGGTAEVPIEKIKVNGELQTPVNKVVDITVPSIEGLTKDADLATVAKSGSYNDLSNKPEIPSIEGLAKTTDIPTKVSDLENDSNYLSSIPEEYVTETELESKGYLTEHQDLSAYAKKTDIPTTLPANGGNADTVNNHTVKSDVPENAVFTDTVYDDTEVKGSIAELSSNLDGLSTYSTEETKVGTWIDGKPIYRKVFKVLKSELEKDENVNTNRWYSPIFALSIDEIVNYDVLAFRNNGMIYKSVDYILNDSYSIIWTFSGFLFKNNSEIRIGSFMGNALYNDLSHIYGILYYTK